MYDAWTSPETLRIVSEVAGIALIPNMEYEIAHINVSVPCGEDSSSDNNSGSTPPVVNWHKDSYPFVCVLMLSDATEMEGGETGLRTGTGELMKIRGPQMVSPQVQCVRRGRCNEDAGLGRRPPRTLHQPHSVPAHKLQRADHPGDVVPPQGADSAR